MAVAEFLGALFEQADQRPVDVAEAEETEVVGANKNPSTVRMLRRCEGETPSRELAGRRCYKLLSPSPSCVPA